MKVFKKIYPAFTLIEIIVAATIFSIILVSVMQIYISSTNINIKTDITRALQQNLKSVVELIADDIKRNNSFIKVESDKSISDCSLEPINNETKSGMKLCIGGNKYYLATKVGNNYVIAEKTDCDEIEEHCTIVNQNNRPLMNSWVDVKDLEFYISDNGVKKVTILMTLQPAIGKGIRPNLIKQNRFYLQTTISQRKNLN